jgi:acyl-CoA thioesterase-2
VQPATLGGVAVSLHPVTDLRTLLDLDQVKPDAFLGGSPGYGWGRLYGGQVVAQALMAAGRTVPSGFHPHSLHAYFVRAGQEDQPVLYEVDRVRDGRSFVTRQVVAHQAGGAILTLSASFQVAEDGPEHPGAIPPAGAPLPESLPRNLEEELFFDSRRVREVREPQPLRVSWIRALGPLGDDPLLHACAFAYLSDDDPMGVILMQHPRYPDWEAMSSASLDHAVWIHRPFRADDWLLVSSSGSGLAHARGVSIGQVFDAQGRHVATVAQEGLGRDKRVPTAPASLST